MRWEPNAVAFRNGVDHARFKAREKCHPELMGGVGFWLTPITKAHSYDGSIDYRECQS
ncbi:hypothetical protein BN2475_280045 [Paraburkholderia ribeironis]|uniref:Uncharacterized protein n=1 Tax=Paraburkholderia ribeironis TaxID=1247936 RepID=A0A1N7S1A3_9BURK|nr:hypothetical protein BN2475_280045 [Paraburkholderia ribeironis]